MRKSFRAIPQANDEPYLHDPRRRLRSRRSRVESAVVARHAEQPNPGADMLNHMEIAVAPLAGRCCSRLAAESREPAIHFAGYLRPRNHAATDRTAPHRTTRLASTQMCHSSHAFPCCCADPESATPRRPPTQPPSSLRPTPPGGPDSRCCQRNLQHLQHYGSEIGADACCRPSWGIVGKAEAEYCNWETGC